MEISVKLQDVTKKYGSKVAVDSLSISISKGETYAFLGPNGAGKTTTIKLMTGLLRSDSGQVFINGKDISLEGQEVRRSICYIPDEPYLYDRLSGREFLHFVGRLYEMDRAVLATEIEKLTEAFECRDFLDAPAGSYSHGMKQRVVVMSGLLHNPNVIILDEPMAGLDPRLIRRFKDILSERTQAGATVFMSTHNLADATEMADRIGIIHVGKLIREGRADEIAVEREHRNLEEVFLALTEK